MKSEFEIAITQLSADRNLAPEIIIEAIESALVSAYKKNFGQGQSVAVSIHPRTGQAQVFVHRTVVEDVTDADTEITLTEARALQPTVALGDTLAVEVHPRNFGRIAAQTAKQVITQRIREAEQEAVYQEYFERAGEIVNGIIRNLDARSQNVTVSLGKAEAVLPRAEQIPGEHYRIGQRLRVYIVEVEKTPKGPQIVVSRAHRDLLRRLLELEVPEIYSGTVEVKFIAREPGFRSKVAVAALQAGIDPVGSCVGMRGVRIQNIVNELSGEKIDVVAWSSDDHVFIANALSPAKATSVYLNPLEHTAKVIVPDKALSLAIGKEGQNARLAAKLTGWRIDIKSEAEAVLEADQIAAEIQETARKTEELDAARRAAAELLAEAQASIADEEPEPVAEELESELIAEVAEAEPVDASEQATAEPALAAQVADAQPEPVAVVEGEPIPTDYAALDLTWKEPAAPAAPPSAEIAVPARRGSKRAPAEPEPEDEALEGAEPELEDEEDEDDGRPARDRRSKRPRPAPIGGLGDRPARPGAKKGGKRERRGGPGGGAGGGRGDWDEWR